MLVACSFNILIENLPVFFPSQIDFSSLDSIHRLDLASMTTFGSAVAHAIFHDVLRGGPNSPLKIFRLKICMQIFLQKIQE